MSDTDYAPIISDPIERATIEEWLTAQLGTWQMGDIHPDHLIKMLIKDIEHLPVRFTNA